MPGLDENQDVWTEGWDWSRRGEEWSQWWGGSDSMWYGALLPRLHAFLPAPVVLEIAPGFGRWTRYLKDVADRLVIVDLAANCIEHCQRRFADARNIEYHVNDGRSLAMVGDGSVDLAFSFDSLVHADADVLEAYLEQLARKLSGDGVGWVHHSNVGSYRRLTALARRVPRRFVGPLITRGALVDIVAWRAESVDTDTFADLCDRAGLVCVSQEEIVWEHGPYMIDAISMFTRRGSRWDRPPRRIRNRHFRSEATRMAQLYARSSFPGFPKRSTLDG